MAAVGLSHYNIKAPRTQLRQLRDFYCQMVGLVEGPRPPIKRFGYWLYAGDDAVLHLTEIPDEEAATPTTPSAAIDHVAFDCSGFDEMKQRLDKGGVPYRISEVPESKRRQIFFKDVTGSGVELQFAAHPL